MSYSLHYPPLRWLTLLLLLLSITTACTPEAAPAPEVNPAVTTTTELATTTADIALEETEETEPTLPPPAVVSTEAEAETAVDTEASVVEPTAVAPLEPTAEPVATGPDNLIAYLSEGTLYIHDLAQGSDPIIVEESRDDYADFISYPIWSPDGEYLLYYRVAGEPNTPTPPEIRVADRQGNWQTIGTNARFSQPAAWSPDGQQIVYLRPSASIPPDQNGTTYDVQRIDRLPEGGFAAEETHGTILWPPDGCGGGGRSFSEELYEAEGGTSYGYRMGVLAWSAPGILLMTDNCTNVGISRYDMNSATLLPDYGDAPLRNLSLTPDKMGWVAVHGWPYEAESGQLAMGDPTAVDFTLLPTDIPVELAFVGQQTGDIYYTSRTPIPTGIEESADMMNNFRFYETTVWRTTAVDNALTTPPTPIFQAPVHAIARLQEGRDGQPLFVWVENETELVNALLNDTIGSDWEEWEPYLPRRHVAQLINSEAENTAVELVPNAGSLAVAP